MLKFLILWRKQIFFSRCKVKILIKKVRIAYSSYIKIQTFSQNGKFISCSFTFSLRTEKKVKSIFFIFYSVAETKNCKMESQNSEEPQKHVCLLSEQYYILCM